MTAALNERQATDFTSATEQAGNLVNQLRRRMQLDERLEQMARNEKELQEQAQGLLEKQVPPVNTVIALGVIFVVGVLILALGTAGFPVVDRPGVLDPDGRGAGDRGGGRAGQVRDAAVQRPAA